MGSLLHIETKKQESSSMLQIPPHLVTSAFMLLET